MDSPKRFKSPSEDLNTVKGLEDINDKPRAQPWKATLGGEIGKGKQGIVVDTFSPNDPDAFYSQTL